VSGCGGLSRPAKPNILGLERFLGKAFHSARWDHGAALEGKRVAVIGTGASAVQIVPAIAPKVGRLFVFQRTPPWIMPKPDRAFGAFERALFRRAPFVQRLARRKIYWQRELLGLGFVAEPRILKLAEVFARRFLKESVPDEALRARLVPSYAMGCKRILPTNDYYPALRRDNVELVTEGIEEVRSGGIATNDGQERAVDAIVLATGFEAAEAVAPFAITGRSGQDLNTVWRDGAEAYLGTTVTGFPNFFMIVGPNTGLGHSSMVLMIESQVSYVLDAIRTMRAENLKLVDVLPDAQARYNGKLHKRLAGTVWDSGCTSWYKTKAGKNTTLWPGFTFEYRLRTRRFDATSYEVVPWDAGPHDGAGRREPRRRELDAATV
jgi:cation diffusion facilitator CzcD-associated flavoprotein CzcO